MSGTVRCRFTATWTEAVLGHGHPILSAVDDAPPRLSALASPWRSVKFPEDPAVLAVMRAAQAEGLPTRFDPGGLAFCERTPLIVDHGGDILGTAWHIARRGDEFDASGFADPEHYAALAARPFVSPGFIVESAEIQRFDGRGAFLFVTRALVIELSATDSPARDGTSFRVAPPQPVAQAERFALEPAGPFVVSTFPSHAEVW